MVPSPATRHSRYRNRHSHTYLDLFIIHDEDPLLKFNKSPSPCIAGPDSIQMKFKLYKAPIQPKRITTRNLKQINEEALNVCSAHKLKELNVPTSGTVNPDDRRLNGENLNKQLTLVTCSSFDELIHKSTFQISSKRKSCVSKEIRTLMRDRDKAYKTA